MWLGGTFRGLAMVVGAVVVGGRGANMTVARFCGSHAGVCSMPVGGASGPTRPETHKTMHARFMKEGKSRGTMGVLSRARHASHNTLAWVRQLLAQQCGSTGKLAGLGGPLACAPSGSLQWP